MTILVLNTSRFIERQMNEVRALAPHETIITDPQTSDVADVEALLAFRLEPGIVPRFPALRFVASAGAGVDQLLATPDLRPDVPLVRSVDPLQGTRMAQYVALMTLRFYRELPLLEMLQRSAQWHRLPQAAESEFTVGVMGYGTVGAPVVDVLARLGFPVAVWTRTARTIDGAEAFAGADGLASFLARSRILVCALPLTPATHGMLDAARLALLPADAYLINVSRGAVLRETDLATALDAGRLAGAALDVYETEPLPAGSPLWRHPKILCTPHIAAEPRPEVVAAQFLDNLRRARSGEPLKRRVDRARGY